ncbi:MAG: hypothetical protein PF495_16125 [Spirochaetales bacterium]|jgi:DNA-directed RNA polymerase subunit RPC12/RpoP|nr:hypothetical protein [Spirochaetales bacterium]
MNEITCSKCGTKMEKGQFLRNGFGFGIGLSWINKIEFKKWEVSNSQRFRTFQYRCSKCGLIETYSELKESE